MKTLPFKIMRSNNNIPLVEIDKPIYNFIEIASFVIKKWFVILKIICKKNK